MYYVLRQLKIFMIFRLNLSLKSMKPLFILLFFLMTSCETMNKIESESVFKKNKQSNAERKNNFYSMIGEKISIQQIENNTGFANGVYEAKYKVIKNIYGDYKRELITFYIRDHRGETPLLNFQHALLFVHKYKGKYYCEPYQYNDVYKTKSGRWAGTYDQQTYSYNRDTSFYPIKIDFEKPVFYPKGEEYPPYGYSLVFEFKPPYFEIYGDSVQAIYGNYVEDLYLLHKNTFFRKKGYFDE
jgi:hypothetical protein